MSVSSKWYVQTPMPDQPANEVRLQPVCRGVENREWSAATPGGSMRMWISNPAALEAFVPGEEYEAVFVHRPKPRAGDGHPVDHYVDHPVSDPSRTLHICRTCGSYARLNPDGSGEPDWTGHDETFGSTPEQRVTG